MKSKFLSALECLWHSQYLRVYIARLSSVLSHTHTPTPTHTPFRKPKVVLVPHHSVTCCKGDDYRQVYTGLAKVLEFPLTLTIEREREIAKVYCNSVMGTGESAQSSSPLDPTFWPLHPAMDRLFT